MQPSRGPSNGIEPDERQVSHDNPFPVELSLFNLHMSQINLFSVVLPLFESHVSHCHMFQVNLSPVDFPVVRPLLESHMSHRKEKGIAL